MKIIAILLFVFAAFSLGAWLAPLLNVGVANSLAQAGSYAVIAALLLTGLCWYREDKQNDRQEEHDRQQRAKNTTRNRDNMTNSP